MAAAHAYAASQSAWQLQFLFARSCPPQFQIFKVLAVSEGCVTNKHVCGEPLQRSQISSSFCRDLCGGWGIAFLAHFLFLLRRYNVSRHDWRWGGLPIWIVVQWPTFKLGEVNCPCSWHANLLASFSVISCTNLAVCPSPLVTIRMLLVSFCNFFRKRLQQLLMRHKIPLCPFTIKE